MPWNLTNIRPKAQRGGHIIFSNNVFAILCMPLQLFIDRSWSLKLFSIFICPWK
ncbi:hypothetical protein MtrunA17_Chr3g0094371 [Medicago truncatula]|uniref:Transmembrane protein n=1 Tax=Medicago truncatula TaxID=3880 RepID=A0A396IM63_MEDTR|nr:hypothetical protein MtrunA17_Chr3g0094371 [Medicago truncatula]